MSRTGSHATGSESPLKATLIIKNPYSNTELTLETNRRELRHEMHEQSLPVKKEDFLEWFVPRPATEGGKPLRTKPENPFKDLDKPPASEKEMYEDYCKRLEQIVSDTGYTFTATPYKGDRTAANPRLAVDCGMYPCELAPKKEELKRKKKTPKEEKDSRRVCWSGIDLPVECKPPDCDPFAGRYSVTARPVGDKPRDAFGQCLSYNELVFHHQQRLFVFTLVFVGDSCRIARVDRSGMFVTEAFKCAEDGDFLVEFLLRYTQPSLKDRGYDPTAEYINPSPSANAYHPFGKLMDDWLKDEKSNLRNEEAHIIALWKKSLDVKWPWWKLRVHDEEKDKERHFLVGKPYSQAPGVRGRGTRCSIAIEVEQDGDSGRSTRNKDRVNWKVVDKFVHLKDCWRVVVTDETADIRKEGATLRKLNDAKVKYVPTLRCHGDVEGQRTAGPEVWNKVNPRFTSPMKTYQHYRLVVDEIGKPLSEFEFSGELVKALHDCLKAHRDAFNIGIIHRDISGGNILLYKKDGLWCGLLNDWELSKDSTVLANPRQLARTGTLQFAAARVLDSPAKAIVIADEVECFFHVLIFYGVRFLKHTMPDKFVGLFLHNYFDLSSGFTEGGDLAAPAAKREVMTSGEIKLNSYGAGGLLQFIWPPSTEDGTITPPSEPDTDHPLNTLIGRLLPWFKALYALDTLKANPPPRHATDPARRGGRLVVREVDTSSTRDPARQVATSSHNQPSPEKQKELWEALAANLNDHTAVVDLFDEILRELFPGNDKGDDKGPKGGYSPGSPETPEFASLPDLDNESFDSQEEDTPDVDADEGAGRSATREVAEALRDASDGELQQYDPPEDAVPQVDSDEELEYYDGPPAVGGEAQAPDGALAAQPDGAEVADMDAPILPVAPRTPSPIPIRPKRGREDEGDAASDKAGGKLVRN